MKIIGNNDKFFIANDGNDTFLMTKHNARFEYSWATLVPPNNGTLFAYSNTHLAVEIEPESKLHLGLFQELRAHAESEHDVDNSLVW